MSRIIDNEKKNSPFIWLTCIGILSLVTLYYYKDKLDFISPTTVTSSPSSVDSQVLAVAKEGAENNKLYTRFFNLQFTQKENSMGVSSKQYAIKFDQNVDIKGVSLSYACSDTLSKATLIGSRNQQSLDVQNGATDILFYSSCVTENQTDSVNQVVWYPDPVHLNAGEKFFLASFLKNIGQKESALSAQVLFYYSWKEETPAPEIKIWRPKRRVQTEDLEIIP